MKKVMREYLKERNKPISGYRVFHKRIRLKRKYRVMLLLFALASVYYGLEFFGIVPTSFFVIDYLAVLSVPLLLLPLGKIHHKTAHKVLLTHDAMAMQNSLKRWRLLFYGDIRKARLSKKNTLVIKGAKTTFKIRLPHYEDNLNVLKMILTCEGHFEQNKRPYKLFFEPEGVQIQELTPSLNPVTANLLESYHDEYKYLTPGYLNDILLYNTDIERVRFFEQRHVVFHLSHIDLKPDHPENYEQKAMKTGAAMILFQDVSHVEIFNIGKNGTKDIELLGTSISTLRKISKGATINEVSFKVLGERTSADMILLQGLKKQKVRFVFKEVISGFNKLTETAWFENK